MHSPLPFRWLPQPCKDLPRLSIQDTFRHTPEGFILLTPVPGRYAGPMEVNLSPDLENKLRGRLIGGAFRRTC
jgi:hypothetical protein